MNTLSPERGCVVLDQPQHTKHGEPLRIPFAVVWANFRNLSAGYLLRLVEDDTAALRRSKTAATALIIFLCLTSSVVAALNPTDLRCEYLRNPLGIDTSQPRLSWILEPDKANARNQLQTAYEILAASSLEALNADRGDLWNSGKIDTNQSTQVVYNGKPLTSEQRCFWKLRVYDQDGKVSGWSAPATWSMGLLAPADWKAKWIGLDGAGEEKTGPEERRLPARWLRKEFSADKRIARATVYMSGLGLSELYLNGKKIGDEVLSPGLTEYPKRVFYTTHDVAGCLKEGKNAIGVILGNGRYYAPRTKVPIDTRTYGFPKLLLQMSIEYADGSSLLITSDDTWKLTADGPIRANNEYDGEEYDERKEIANWSETGCKDSTWVKASLVTGPEGKLVAQMINPIRVTDTLKPIAVTEPKPGVFIFDIGQNMVGWCRLHVSGPAATKISMRHAETLKPDGTLYLDNIRSAKVTDSYFLKGAGTETYEPRFTYHGFRYVELTGFPGKPSLTTIEGCVVNDDVEKAGEFACSDELVNRIYKNIFWGVRGNYRSLPTDCPQRDERQGWLGDRAGEAKGETYLFDTAALHGKWLQDMADAQKDNGSVPDVCPSYWPIYSDNVTWPSATVIVPGGLLEQYGDTRIIASHYDSAKKWLDHMREFMKDGLIWRDNYGDWCVPPENAKLIHSEDPMRKTKTGLLASAYLFHDAMLMASYAKLLGKADDQRQFEQLAAEMKSAFNQKFWNSELGQYDNGSQTSCVLPLAFGLVTDDDQKARVFQRLINKIRDESQGHIGTGLVGGQWLNRVLSDNGRADLAWQIATQRAYPSWGYMVDQGATTIWELWNGNTADPAMNSGNHVMLVGDLCIWLHEYVAGIRPDPLEPGFKHIIFKPEVIAGLNSARATHRSPYGLIESDWKHENGTFSWRLTVPVNSTATVFVPAENLESIKESGKSVSEARGLNLVKFEKGRGVLEAGSGRYEFQSRASAPAAPAAQLTSGVAAPLGIFEGQGEVGKPSRTEPATFDAGTGTYTISGGGENMWFTNDSFHFVWKKVSGDFLLGTDVSWPSTGGNGHRKACLMVRQDLTADSPYVDIASHGDGLTSLQFREQNGGLTHEVQNHDKGPTRLALVRQGDTFVLETATGTDAQPKAAGPFMRIKLQDPVYVGLAVCAHDDKALETAKFSSVRLEALPAPATDTKPVLHCALEIIPIGSKDRRVVYHSVSNLIEAPNWTRDGKELIFNSGGRLYRIPTTGGEPTQIDTAFANRCNNDHGLSPDGTTLAISDQSQGGKSKVYTVPLTGGTPKLITPQAPSYWHGWSPDGSTLAYCAERNSEFDVYTMAAEGGEEKRLTTAKGLDDGPEYSPDGKYIYFNSDRTGIMQIWRMKPDGSDQEQVTNDEYNNWFAHPSPDGKWLVFLSFEKEVTGHPANKVVKLRLMPTAGGSIQELAHLFGGQGTINVPSWSPDSRQIAFVSYELLR